jgi:hypothetical protein
MINDNDEPCHSKYKNLEVLLFDRNFFYHDIDSVLFVIPEFEKLPSQMRIVFARIKKNLQCNFFHAPFVI